MCRKIGRTTSPSTPRRARRDFLREQTGVALDQVGAFWFDPSTLQGNIENFTGVAQVPIGVAGPLLINGEHARGEFLVPLATTEGTLVASYNRGMRLLTECGGVTTTVVDDQDATARPCSFSTTRSKLESSESGSTSTSATSKPRRRRRPVRGS